MSPQNKKKIDSLRKQLDKLDNNLLKIVKKRTNIIKQVLSLKEYKKQIGCGYLGRPNAIRGSSNGLRRGTWPATYV